MFEFNIYYIFYCVSSNLLTICLVNWFLLQLKGKTAFSLKLFHFSPKGKLIIVCCFCYIIFYIFLKNFNYSDLVSHTVILPSFIFIFLKQFGYSFFETNSCLDDTKSTGAYWAHQTWDAYYKIVLEGIKDRMADFEKEHNIKIYFKKLIIIIPLSCNAEGTLPDRDDTIKEVGFLKPIESDQGANINRTYRSCVFKIFEDTYVVAEFSSPVSTLWKSKSELEKEKRDYIRNCYIKTLKSLVIGSAGIVVEYDDVTNSSQTLSDCILSSIKENNYFV